MYSSRLVNGRSPTSSSTLMLMKSGGYSRLVRTTFAVGGARRLVGLERRGRVLSVRQQAFGQHARVDRALGCAVRAARIHRMGGVAGERDAAKRPALDRVLVDHRVFEDLIGGADQLGDV